MWLKLELYTVLAFWIKFLISTGRNVQDIFTYTFRGNNILQQQQTRLWESCRVISWKAFLSFPLRFHLVCLAENNTESMGPIWPDLAQPQGEGELETERTRITLNTGSKDPKMVCHLKKHAVKRTFLTVYLLYFTYSQTKHMEITKLFYNYSEASLVSHANVSSFWK